MHYMILYTPDTEKYMDFIIIDNDLKRGDKIKKKSKNGFRYNYFLNKALNLYMDNHKIKICLGKMAQLYNY